MSVGKGGNIRVKLPMGRGGKQIFSGGLRRGRSCLQSCLCFGQENSNINFVQEQFLMLTECGGFVGDVCDKPKEHHCQPLH